MLEEKPAPCIEVIGRTCPPAAPVPGGAPVPGFCIAVPIMPRPIAVPMPIRFAPVFGRPSATAGVVGRPCVAMVSTKWARVGVVTARTEALFTFMLYEAELSKS